ncbi:MAG: radical SAM protein [Xanthomonadales bacterium]|nr:radical SAM protein [Xanthomonadales bacterium]
MSGHGNDSAASRQVLAQRILLLHPPYGDFTYPYHSLSYVAAAIDATGAEAEILDLNALWFRSVFDAGAIAALGEDIDTELAALDASPELDLSTQGRIADLLRAKAICGFLQPAEVVATLRGEAFYQPEAYAEARAQVRAFEALLGIVYGPYDFFNAFAAPAYEPTAARMLAKVYASTRLRRDLVALLRRHAVHGDYLFVGVSMPFSTHLVPGFCLLDAVAEVFPGTPRIAGGTAITDIVKYRCSDAALAPLRACCDGLFVGEAELGLAALLAWVRDGGEAPTQVVVPGEPARIDPSAQRYVALRPAESRDGRFEAFDWARYPPRYDWIDWRLYLAPERRVNYAPVRGCFWNQCTFCDYGLNSDRPTAPSRHMDTATALATVARLRAEGVTHFYLAADALPPNFLQRFAEGLIAQQIDISWSCELYLTHGFDDRFVQLMQRSGLRQASFGLESGSARVLEAMGKGINRVERVLRPALAAFARSDIALQPLFFFGFPGETDEDRQATVDLLIDHAGLFTPISKGGTFALLAGSAIARDPATFGLTNLRRAGEDELGGILDYERIDGEPMPDCVDFGRFNALLPHCDAFERPWAGGIDTLHTHLWVDRYGRAVFERLRPVLAGHGERRLPVAVTSRFDVEELIQNVLIDRTVRANPQGLLPADMAPLLAELGQPIEHGRPRRYELAVRPFGGMFAA